MSETLIVMAAVVVVGLLPIIIIAALAIHAINKSLTTIEQSVNERSTKFDEGIEEINQLLDQKDQLK